MKLMFLFLSFPASAPRGWSDGFWAYQALKFCADIHTAALRASVLTGPSSKLVESVFIAKPVTTLIRQLPSDKNAGQSATAAHISTPHVNVLLLPSAKCGADITAFHEECIWGF